MRFGPRVHVALLGLRCAGKSAIGTELAERLALPFVDLDLELALAFGGHEDGVPRAAGEILRREGVERFRDLEEATLIEALLRPRPHVIATGGGVVERAANRRRLAGSAACVWLRVPLDELARRMRADPTARPSILGKDPVEEIADLARRREPRYAETADLALDCGLRDPAAIAEELAQVLAGVRARREG